MCCIRTSVYVRVSMCVCVCVIVSVSDRSQSVYMCVCVYVCVCVREFVRSIPESVPRPYQGVFMLLCERLRLEALDGDLSQPLAHLLQPVQHLHLLLPKQLGVGQRLL